MGIFKKRSISSLGKKKSDMPEGLWNKCPSCGAIIDEITLKQRNRVCTKCDHHFTLTSQERVAMLLDPDSFDELDPTLESTDALGFKGYIDKVKGYQKKTGLKDAVCTAAGSATTAAAIALSSSPSPQLGCTCGDCTRFITAATAARKRCAVSQRGHRTREKSMKKT
jgi:acetyl-CoA carboxylase carboxyl transferase subunit beta